MLENRTQYQGRPQVRSVRHRGYAVYPHFLNCSCKARRITLREHQVNARDMVPLTRRGERCIAMVRVGKNPAPYTSHSVMLLRQSYNLRVPCRQ
jgi:hypothetical protein